MVRVVVSESVGAEDALAVWPVCDAVFGDHPDVESWREAVWDRHAARAGFRLARAYDDDDLLVLRDLGPGIGDATVIMGRRSGGAELV